LQQAVTLPGQQTYLPSPWACQGLDDEERVDATQNAAHHVRVPSASSANLVFNDRGAVEQSDSEERQAPRNEHADGLDHDQSGCDDLGQDMGLGGGGCR
jgi:hypothetical protein